MSEVGLAGVLFAYLPDVLSGQPFNHARMSTPSSA